MFDIFPNIYFTSWQQFCRNKSPMSAGSSFYLILSFKVAGGNGFQDSISRLSLREITDTQVASLSLFLARCITTFIQPSARMLTTKSQLLLTFLLLCQSRLAKICMYATHVFAGDKTGILQIVPPRTAMFHS